MGSWNCLTDFSKYILTFKSESEKVFYKLSLCTSQYYVSYISVTLHLQKIRHKRLIFSSTVPSSGVGSLPLLWSLTDSSKSCWVYFPSPLVMPLKQGLENPTSSSFTEDTTRPAFLHMLVGPLAQESRSLSSKDTEMGVGAEATLSRPSREGQASRKYVYSCCLQFPWTESTVKCTWTSFLRILLENKISILVFQAGSLSKLSQ